MNLNLISGSTSATTTAFVPPPAVPGHSRWLLAQGWFSKSYSPAYVHIKND